MNFTHPLRRPGRKWLLPVIASIILFCLSARAAAAENDINGSLLSDIGLTYGEIAGKYGGETNLSGFEGELFAEFAHNSYSFRSGEVYDAAYSGEGPFDVIPEDDAVCYAINTTAGALFPWLDGSCTVSELVARGFPASVVSSREAAFAGEIEGAYCHFVYGERAIDIALDESGNGAADAFSKASAAFISSAADANSDEGQNEIFGEWAKVGDDYPYENLTKFCLYPDYTFKGTINLLDRMGFIAGVYTIDGDTARCTVLSNDFAGYTGSDTEQFDLLYSGGTMLYLGGTMGDLYCFEGPEVLEKMRSYLNEPSDTSPDSGEPSEPGPFEPYTLELHYGCPIYDRPSSAAGTVTAYIDFSTLYTIVEQSTDEYGVVWGKLKSGVGWVCLPVEE